jgi:membrane-associated phospholipid phosphatase
VPTRSAGRRRSDARGEVALVAVSAIAAIAFLALTVVFWLGANEGEDVQWQSAEWTRVLGGPGVLPPVTLVLALAIGLVGTWVQARFLVIVVAGAGLVMYAARVLLQVWGADGYGGRLPQFPSGHAAATTALAGALVVIAWSATTAVGMRIAALVCALTAVAAICTARVVGGFHTPLDVAGGVALAVSWLALTTLVAPPDGSRWLTRTQALAALLAVGVSGFVFMAALYGQEPLSTVDGDVARHVAESMPGWAEAIARPFSWLGGWIGIAALSLTALVLLVRERNRLDLGFLVAAVAGSQLVVFLLKVWFDRPRPDVGSAVPLPSSPSFPSGHATSGVACIGAFAVLAAERLPRRRARACLWVSVVALGVAIGLSRIVLDVHYVTDVLAGWCLGLAWLAACLLARDSLRGRLASSRPRRASSAMLGAWPRHTSRSGG